MQPQGTPENGYSWQRVNSQLSSPSQPYSLREALLHAQSSRIGASAQALRESLHPILRQKLVRFLQTSILFNCQRVICSQQYIDTAFIYPARFFCF